MSAGTQQDLTAAQAAKREQLWLQTSEGPNASYGKTQVVAEFVSKEPASHAAAHPKARPEGLLTRSRPVA